ncbi:MAG: SPOR domain-containing protein, partial [Bacteroidota bacterium]|nr:SPOR domain-containing protein [Bacteroidota bacterium]
TAGMFTSFEDADLAKNKIRSMNYKDAFVVAYLNGRRININEARQMAENNPQLAQRAELAVSNNIKNNISQPEQIQPVKVMKNLPIENSAYKEIIPPDGFYYTVQVGVFKRKIRPEEHYNLDSLHYKNMPNGNLRYYSGIFFRGRTALSARQRIINKGVKGAFVVAFNNGNQINLDDALRLEQPTNQLAPAQQQIVKTEPTVKKMKTEEVNNLVNISNTAKLNIPEGKIIYKIQIGAYKNEVPVEVVNLMLKIVNKGIEQSKSNDMTIYLAGTFEDYKSANDFRQMVNKEGIPDAFVVAFNGQHKITVTDAMKAKGE